MNAALTSPAIKRVLWNHSMEGAYPPEQLAEIPGVWRYGSRALCCTNPNDTIQLHSDLESEITWVLSHYRNVGLNPTENIVWDADINLVSRNGKFQEHDWSVFLFSDLHHSANPDDRRAAATRDMNEKNDFIQACIEHDWPIPQTHCFDSPAEASDFVKQIDFSTPWYRKTSCSAAGQGVVKATSPEELLCDLQKIEARTRLQVQQCIGSQPTFYNIQYHGGETGVSRVAVTEQLLEGFEHTGNIFPCDEAERIFEVCDPAAQYLWERGLRSYFALDAGIGDSGDPLLIECNPRWNACTYYWKVAKKLGVSTWLSRSRSVPTAKLEEIRLDGIEFDPASSRGIIIVSWGTILEKKVGLFVAGRDKDELLELESQFEEMNPIH